MVHGDGFTLGLRWGVVLQIQDTGCGIRDLRYNMWDAVIGLNMFLGFVIVLGEGGQR